MSKPTSVTDLPSPCFLVDKDRVEMNTSRMLQTCKDLDLTLRPHTKTHKTLELAVMSTGGSKKGITVSTLKEAEFYVENGFDDILLAYPISEDKIDRCIALMKRIQSFHVMISDLSGVACLKKAQKKLPENTKWSVAIEIDTGYGRTGFAYDSEEFVLAFKDVCTSMKLLSVYNHCGMSYDITTKKEREEHHRVVVERMMSCKSEILSQFPTAKFDVGVGSTPSCNLPSKEHNKLDEFHPGNYIFNDYEQCLLNACREKDIACKVMTRVIAHKEEKSMILVDCGFLALGHDGIRQRPDDFCLIEGERNLKLVGMTQEIGKIVAKEGELDCRKYPVGTIFYIYPFHSCLTAALHGEYHVHSGDKLVDKWTPAKWW